MQPSEQTAHRSDVMTINEAMHIPLIFALDLIPSIDSETAFETLKDWHLTALAHQLSNTDSKVCVAPNVWIECDDLDHLFSGPFNDMLTSHGAFVLKHIIKQGLLGYPKDSYFPKALEDYIDLGIGLYQPGSLCEDVNKTREALKENEFTYSNLFSLFHTLKGSQLGKTLLSIGGITVTRFTKRVTGKDAPENAFESVFLWENESCRTQALTRTDANRYTSKSTELDYAERMKN